MLELFGPLRALVVDRAFVVVERGFYFTLPGASQLQLGLSFCPAVVQCPEFFGTSQEKCRKGRNFFTRCVQLVDGCGARLGTVFFRELPISLELCTRIL